MSREKQIEEMTNDLCNIECKGMKCNVCGTGCEYRILAEALYNAGYRKQSEGEWVEKDDGFGGVYYDCTACGCSWTTIDGTPMENNMNYCPECGAKMTGSAENATDINVGNKSKWISVEERLPEADTDVLVITCHGSFKVARCNIYHNGTLVLWMTNDGLGEKAITHWMPLPEPPKKGGAE